MSLIKRNPAWFSPLFPSLFDDFFGREWVDLRNSFSGGSALPAVNVKQEPDQFVLEVAAPGLNREDFRIELDQQVLTISSKKETRNETRDENGNYTRREFGYTAFSRSFTLPETVKTEGISARYDQGVLYVHIPKHEAAQTNPSRLIEIG